MSAPGGEPGRRPRIGLWGVFDVEDAGQMAARAGVAGELGRILPDAEVLVRAPLGDLHPLALDGGEAALPLAGIDPGLLAAEADAVVVCGGEIGVAAGHLDRLYGADLRDQAAAGMSRLLAGPGGAAPAAWVAVGLAAGARRTAAMRPATVLDAATARVAGAGTAEVVAHPALLLGAGVGAERRQLRRRFLEAVGWLPAAGPLLAVQGDTALGPVRDSLAASLRSWCAAAGGTVVLIAGGRVAGEDAFADALSATLGHHGHRLPDTVSVDDLAAALAAASGCVASRAGIAALAAGLGVAVVGVGDDPVLAGTLAALGAPAAIAAGRVGDGLASALPGSGPRGDAPMAASVDAARQRLVDALTDAVSASASADRDRAIDVDAAQARLNAALSRLDALDLALRARGRRLVEDRSVYLRLLAEHDEEVRGLRAELAVLRAELERTRATLATVLGSRTWKLTEPARELAERIRRRRR